MPKTHHEDGKIIAEVGKLRERGSLVCGGSLEAIQIDPGRILRLRDVVPFEG
jgi:hypothetical protein